MPDADSTTSPVGATSTPMVTQAQIEAFEDRLSEALQAGDDQHVPVVGYGEVSVALRLSTPQGDFVCKRLVPFSSRREALRSADLIASYVEQLERTGIDVVSTETPILERAAGHILYCVQPMLPRAALGPRFLKNKNAEEAAPHVKRIFDLIRSSVTPTLALDGQLSNWAFQGDRLCYFDVGTPFLRDARGNNLFDFQSQSRVLPPPIRFVVNRFLLQGILDNYHSVRGQALDFLGNLTKEGMQGLTVPMIRLANEVFAFATPITEKETCAHYEGDAKSYALIQLARRADRWVHQRILRKPYPYLLPPRIERFGKSRSGGHRA